MAFTEILPGIHYVGVNDRTTTRFESLWSLPYGVSYNSYLVIDEKVALIDTVEVSFGEQFIDNIRAILKDRPIDYLVVDHMEPDHSSSIKTLRLLYPEMQIVGNAKTLQMLDGYYGIHTLTREVKEGESISLGQKNLSFYMAPMVHWPEVMVTYCPEHKVLFSADAFGTFGALNGGILDSQLSLDHFWDEMRRYYACIVGKYGAQVQSLLKRAAGLDIQMICPLHGPVLTENLGYYLNLYDIWSSYRVESDGIVVAYTSVYGHTKAAAELLAQKLADKGCPKVIVHDLARCDMAKAVEDAFRYGKLVLATTTYNADVFPFMKEFIHHLTERNFQSRTIGLMENGSWAPLAAKTMRKMLEGSKNLTFTDTTVKILSALNDDSKAQIESMANELCKDYLARQDETANKNNLDALFNIGYGLYVVTSSDGSKDNGLIVNTVSQVTNTPNRIAVTINKQNYSHHVIKQTGVMNVCCLDTSAPFSVFQTFGFQSGRTADKFAGIEELRSDNGLRFLPRYINSFMSLKVESYVDLDTHGMFICSVTEARVISDRETMTYTYYQNNVKPKPETEGKHGFVCKVCGWVYEGDTLPDDIVCPLCKHGAADFEPIG